MFNVSFGAISIIIKYLKRPLKKTEFFFDWLKQIIVIEQYLSGIYSQNDDEDWFFSQKMSKEETWKVRNDSCMLISQLGEIHM